MQSVYDILMLLISIARFFILAHFIISWLISFQVLNARQPLVATVWGMLQRLLEPLYAPLRRVLPTPGGIDFTPLVVLIGLTMLEIVLRNNVALFY
jgi:YggT family protein